MMTFIGMSGVMKELIHVKDLEPCLAQRKLQNIELCTT